jgi:hypothetical protein
MKQHNYAPKLGDKTDQKITKYVLHMKYVWPESAHHWSTVRPGM